MKKLLLLFIVCSLFIGCNTATNTPEKETTNNQNNTETTTTTESEEKLYPSLKVENNVSGSNQIMAVSMVNYDFSPLGIQGGKSQTFILDKGMPGGYENILIEITFGNPRQTAYYPRIYKNFEDGKTTLIQINPSSGGGWEIQ